MTSIGSQHPLPENIPHLTSPIPTNVTNGNGNGHGNGHGHGAVPGIQSGSPVKEASFLHRETSVDDPPLSPKKNFQEETISPPAKEGVPTRWQA